MGLIFGRLGITLEACSSWFLPRIVGHQQALAWAYRAAVFEAAEAYAKGLVRTCARPSACRDKACAFALAVFYISRLHGREGVQAFLEKTGSGVRRLRVEDAERPG